MKDPEQLAAAHWKYVSGLLQAYGVKTGAADEYMYKATFAHGFKHGVDAAKETALILRDEKGAPR